MKIENAYTDQEQKAELEREVRYLESHDEIRALFGTASLSRDGEVFWEVPDTDGPVVTMTCGEAESVARQDPDHDWRISFEARTWSEEYQRQGPGRWKLIREGKGFA